MSNFTRGLRFLEPEVSLVDETSTILGEGEGEIIVGVRGLGVRIKGSLAQILHATVVGGELEDDGFLNIEHSSDGVVWERCTHVKLLADGSEGEPLGEITLAGEASSELFLLVEQHTGDDYLRGTIGLGEGEFDGVVSLDVIRIGGTPFASVEPDYSDLEPDEGEA